MRTLSFLAATTIAATLASCGGKQYDAGNDPVTAMYDSMHKADSLKEWGPPKAITFADARDTGSLDNSRITIEGYISVGSTIYESESSTNFQLWERKNQNAGDYISVGIDLGTGNNKMKSLPDKYKKTDVSITDDKGNKVGYGDKVKVTAIYSRPYSDGYGSLHLQSLEKIEDTPLDYSKLEAKKITTDTSNYSALDGQLVYAEGFLEIPSMVYITETVYFDLYPKQGSNDYVTVDIVIGNGPNLVEDLPDNYGENDIKIHDHKDMIVGKKKVRVYGVWKYNRIAAEFIETI